MQVLLENKQLDDLNGLSDEIKGAKSGKNRLVSLSVSIALAYF
jgi:hypothetical protein